MTMKKGQNQKGKRGKVGSQTALTLATATGLTVSQTKALESLMAGRSLTEAAKAAGVMVSTLKIWRDSSEPFKAALAQASKDLSDRIERARKDLIANVIQTGAAGASVLLRHVQSNDARVSLSASKAAYAGAVTLAKSQDADTASFGPMFVLPAGTVMSLDTSAPALPTANVIDAQVIEPQVDSAQTIDKVPDIVS